ncbi:GDP-L-fucose synthase family protein [Candidatus Pelagibacter bacterium nBUS_30]|uniref:GDP-L-fucose synthase family protein n=1 Tax=Candidatus Pelagibacter bacterium nBUS_30 TaxID=3374191 RepID=UPI003EBC9732
MINFKSKIYIAGHKGLVGSAILRKLKVLGYKNVIYTSRKKLDLTNQSEVNKYLKINKPKFIFIAAAKVGGVFNNQNNKAEFITQNLLIQTNLIYGAYLAGVKDLIFLGSSCIYPKNCKQPIKENYLLDGKLEETNDAYAIAKIAGVKMCQSYNEQFGLNYKCLMPTNSFGPNDNYDGLNSHFFPALIKKIHNIRKKNSNRLVLWGNGKAKREVLYVDDLADACIYFMKKKTKHKLINIGSGKDYSITYYAQLISKLILGKKVLIKYDKSKPNGIFRKVMDISIAKKYGWKPKISLENAILKSYDAFKNEKVS